jgi:5-methylcytosine-specific restriction endonuclease McrA
MNTAPPWRGRWTLKKFDVLEFTLVSRTEARARGLKRYFTGEPCPQGHVCERMVANADCIECMRARNGRRYRDNSEYRRRALIRMRNNYVADPEKYRERSRRAYQKNPWPWRVRQAAYRATAVGAHGSFDAEDIARIFEAQNGRCNGCGIELAAATWHVDHIVPLSRGGANSADNIQILCASCNCRKWIRTMDEWNRRTCRAFS